MDNEKAAGLEFHLGDHARFHPWFFDLADHYYGCVRACQPKQRAKEWSVTVASPSSVRFL